MNFLQKDALKEVANIGTGNAARALSELIGKRVDMSVPEVEMLPLEDVAFHFGHPETPVCAVLSTCDRNLEANLVFIMAGKDAEKLSEMLLDKISIPVAPSRIPELRESALAEAGNIVLGAFISALGNLMNLQLDLSVPSVAFDMLGSIMNVMVAIFGAAEDTAFLIDTRLSFPEDEDHFFSGRIMFIPGPGSLESFFSFLGVR